MARFIQFHALASYPAVLLNRDDAGLAKRLPYGGSSRIRVSSQCLKRHWRMTQDEWSLRKVGAPLSVRSREIIELKIKPALAGKAAQETIDGVCLGFAKALYGKNSAKIQDRQALLLGMPEIAYLTKLAGQVAEAASDAKDAEARVEALFKDKSQKANLSAMKENAGDLAAGLEAALFGRMVTSDPEANADAAIHVAHAFTVHAEESESDYFTVVDDLAQEAGRPGSGGIFDTELTSGLFYVYVVVDVPGLIDNLGGDRGLAAKVVEHLAHLIATISPGAKKGSTAPYAYADLMLAEFGGRQPRSLAGAFRKPVVLDGKADALALAGAKLARHLGKLDGAYGKTEERVLLSVADEEFEGLPDPVGLDALAARAAAAAEAGA